MQIRKYFYIELTENVLFIIKYLFIIYYLFYICYPLLYLQQTYIFKKRVKEFDNLKQVYLCKGFDEKLPKSLIFFFSIYSC